MKTQTVIKKIRMGAAVLALSLGLINSTRADQTISADFAMPIRVSGEVTMDCSNSQGPEVTLSGSLFLGGVNVRAIFRNNVKGTHSYTNEYVSTGVLLPENESITIPKQPALGGTGGNPFIWVQFLDGEENPLTGEIYLGRCVQGPVPVDASALGNVLADADVKVDCSNNPGPFITVTGGLTLSGLKARFIFRNNDNPVGGPHKTDRTVDVVLVPAGATIQFPKQPVLGGVGGNPHMWVQLTAPDGTPYSGEFYLGRCVQSAQQ